jgi:hypothetical protein
VQAAPCYTPQPYSALRGLSLAASIKVERGT